MDENSVSPVHSLLLDDLDRRILEQLQRDSALTNQDLAAKVHASPPACGGYGA